MTQIKWSQTTLSVRGNDFNCGVPLSLQIMVNDVMLDVEIQWQSVGVVRSSQRGLAWKGASSSSRSTSLPWAGTPSTTRWFPKKMNCIPGNLEVKIAPGGDVRRAHTGKPSGNNKSFWVILADLSTLIWSSSYSKGFHTIISGYSSEIPSCIKCFTGCSQHLALGPGQKFQLIQSLGCVTFLNVLGSPVEI